MEGGRRVGWIGWENVYTQHLYTVCSGLTAQHHSAFSMTYVLRSIDRHPSGVYILPPLSPSIEPETWHGGA